MRIKLDVEGEVWHIIRCYAPQTGSPQDEKETFLEYMDSEMQTVTRNERVVVSGDLNGHVGIDRTGYNNVHGGHGLDVDNEDGIQVLDFATAYEMRIINTFNHLVTYNSGGRESQIDYNRLRTESAKECTNCKVLPQEAVTTQHRVVVAELEVKAARQRRAEGRKQIRWWKLKDEKVKGNFMKCVVDILSNRIEVMTTNVDEWWEETARQIRTYGEEICGRSSGKKKPGLERWWWNEETEKAVKEKKDKLKTWKRTSVRKRQKGVQTSESDSKESGCESESGSNRWAV